MGRPVLSGGRQGDRGEAVRSWDHHREAQVGHTAGDNFSAAEQRVGRTGTARVTAEQSRRRFHHRVRTMPVRRGHVAPQNTFLDTIIRKFEGQSKYKSPSEP